MAAGRPLGGVDDSDGSPVGQGLTLQGDVHASRPTCPTAEVMSLGSTVRMSVPLPAFSIPPVKPLPAIDQSQADGATAHIPVDLDEEVLGQHEKVFHGVLGLIKPDDLQDKGEALADLLKLSGDVLKLHRTLP